MSLLPIQFTDRIGGVGGTNLKRSALGAAQIMNTCLKSGTLPTSESSLNVTLPAIVMVVNLNDGSAAVEVQINSTTLTMSGGASTDNYIFVDQSGNYSQQSQATGLSLMTPPVGTVCLCYYTTNSANNAITLTQVAPNYGLKSTDIAAVTGASISGFTYDITKSVGDQIKALASAISSFSSAVDTAARNAIASMYGVVSFGSVGSKKAILEDGTNADATVNFNAINASGTVTSNAISTGNIVSSGNIQAASLNTSGGITNVSGLSVLDSGLTVHGATNVDELLIGSGSVITKIFTGNFDLSNRFVNANSSSVLSVSNASINTGAVASVCAADHFSNPMPWYFTITAGIDSTGGVAYFILTNVDNVSHTAPSSNFIFNYVIICTT